MTTEPYHWRRRTPAHGWHMFKRGAGRSACGATRLEDTKEATDDRPPQTACCLMCVKRADPGGT